MRPGSLRQLILASFVFASVPLGVFLWLSQKSVDSLGNIAIEQAQSAVIAVRALEQLKNRATDAERLIGQYRIVTSIGNPSDSDLGLVVSNYIQALHQDVGDFCQQFDQLDCSGVIGSTIWLKDNFRQVDQSALEQQLEQFRVELSLWGDEADSLLNQRISAQQEQVEKIQQSQQYWVLAMLLLTAIVIYFSSRWIARPIERLQTLIRAIANQDKDLPELNQTDPKELRRLGTTLRELALRLNELENARHSMLRHASHELKTPLASLKEGTSLLLEEVVGPLSPQQQEVAELLGQSSERMEALIEQLLDYNRLMQQQAPQWQKVTASSVLNPLVSDNALAIQQHHHQVTLNIQEDEIWTDTALFRRVLDNLLSNAIAYGKPGSTIFIDLYREQQTAVVEVGNQGNPIALSDRSKLFEPFFRLDNARKDRVSGSGLGLSIVADCVRMLKGQVSIVDSHKADVSVRVTLPQPTEENVLCD